MRRRGSGVDDHRQRRPAFENVSSIPSIRTAARRNWTARRDIVAVVIVGAGPVGLAPAIDLAQRGVPVRGARRRRHRQRRLARHLLRQAHAGDLRPPGLRRRIARQGRVAGTSARSSSATRLCLSVRPAARGRPPPAGLRQPAAVPLRGLPGRARASAAGCRPALEAQAWSASAAPTTASTLRVETPDGDYTLDVRLAGRRATARAARCATCSGWKREGQVFRDRFLIADVHMTSDFPTRALVLVRSAVPPDQSVLLHRQADDVWRIDFQLGWDADPEEEKKPENIMPRAARACSARTREFDSSGPASTPSSAGAWSTSATAACCSPATPRTVFAVRRARRQQRRAGRRQPRLEARAGAARAGARGAARHLRRRARLRRPTRTSCNSTRATDFITPKSEVAAHVPRRGAGLARRASRSRARWSTAAACRCRDAGRVARSTRRTHDAFAGAMVPGAPAADAPVVRSARRLAAANIWMAVSTSSFSAMPFGRRRARPRAELAHAVCRWSRSAAWRIEATAS